MATVIKRNTTIPCRKEKIFTTDEDNQTEVGIFLVFVVCETATRITFDALRCCYLRRRACDDQG